MDKIVLSCSKCDNKNTLDILKSALPENTNNELVNAYSEMMSSFEIREKQEGSLCFGCLAASYSRGESLDNIISTVNAGDEELRRFIKGSSLLTTQALIQSSSGTQQDSDVLIKECLSFFGELSNNISGEVNSDASDISNVQGMTTLFNCMFNNILKSVSDSPTSSVPLHD